MAFGTVTVLALARIIGYQDPGTRNETSGPDVLTAVGHPAGGHLIGLVMLELVEELGLPALEPDPVGALSRLLS